MHVFTQRTVLVGRDFLLTARSHLSIKNINCNYWDDYCNVKVKVKLYSGIIQQIHPNIYYLLGSYQRHLMARLCYQRVFIVLSKTKF